MRGSHGTFYWNELMTRDVEGAKKFYADTLGWSYDAMPMPGVGGTYWLATMEGEPAGTICPSLSVNSWRRTNSSRSNSAISPRSAS